MDKVIRSGNLAERMCGNKIKYATAREAYLVVNGMLRRNKFRKTGKINVYCCPFCLYWHIGHGR